MLLFSFFVVVVAKCTKLYSRISTLFFFDTSGFLTLSWVDRVDEHLAIQTYTQTITQNHTLDWQGRIVVLQ